MRFLTYLVNTPFYAFLTGLFLLPFIYAVEPRVEYEQAKVYFFQRWVEALWIFLIIFNAEKFSIKRLLTKVNLFLVGFLLIAFFSSYYGTDYTKSIWGNTFRIDGLFTLLHSVALFFFVQMFWEQRFVKRLSVVIVFSSLLVSIYSLGAGIHDYINGIYQYNPWKAIYGTLGNPVFLGGYLLLTLPFFLGIRKKGIVGILPLTSIIFTFSRFAVAGVFFIPLLKVALAKFKIKPIKLFYLFLLLSVGYFAFFGIKASRITQEYRAGNEVVYEDRMRVYTKGFLGYLERPLFGYGYANFDNAFEAVDWPASIPNDAYVDKAHSSFLEVLTTTGIVGFVFYLLFLTCLFNKLKVTNSFSITLFISLFLFLINSQINVTSIAQEALFWIFAGILTNKNYD